MIHNWLRGLTTNFARLDPDSSDPELRPIHLPVSPEQAGERLRQWVEKQRLWSVVECVETGPEQKIRLTRRTRLFRFTDDVGVTIRPHESGDGCQIDADSQSRVGKGDLGQNSRNLKELRRGLTDRR